MTFTLTLPKGFKAGYIEYTFPYTRGHLYATRELFGSYSYSGIVNAGVNAFYDIGTVGDFESDGTTPTAPRSGKASPSTTRRPSAWTVSSAWPARSSRDYDGTKGGLYNYNLSAKLSYKATEKMGIGAVVGYAGSLDKEVLIEQEEKFYVGANFSVGF